RPQHVGRCSLSPVLLDAIKLIRRRADKAKSDDLELVALAAHLYAIGQQILNFHGDASLVEESPKPPDPAANLLDLLTRLASLSLDLDAAGLYQVVLDALGFLDKDFGRSEEDWLPPSTRLDAIPDGDRDFLSGTVQHWIRQPSRLARERHHRYAAAD